MIVLLEQRWVYGVKMVVDRDDVLDDVLLVANE